VVGGCTTASAVKCAIVWVKANHRVAQADGTELAKQEMGKLELLVNVQNWSTVKLKEMIVSAHRDDLPTSIEDFDLYFRDKLLQGELKNAKLHKRLKRATKIVLKLRDDPAGRVVSVDASPVRAAVPLEEGPRPAGRVSVIAATQSRSDMLAPPRPAPSAPPMPPPASKPVFTANAYAAATNTAGLDPDGFM